jgi:hypothetical protein
MIAAMSCSKHRGRLGAILQLLIVVSLMSGCSLGAPSMEDRSPVKQLSVDEYIYYFKYTDGCLTNEQTKSCAQIQLVSRKLIPFQCLNGVEVLSGSGPSNGWLFAKFRCAK